jgi:hypothetical protein
MRSTTARVDPRSGSATRPGFVRKGTDPLEPWEVTMLTIILIVVVILLLTGGFGYSRRGRRGV